MNSFFYRMDNGHNDGVCAVTINDFVGGHHVVHLGEKQMMGSLRLGLNRIVLGVGTFS